MKTDRINQLADRYMPDWFHSVSRAPLHEFARAIEADVKEEYIRSTRKGVGFVAVVIGLLFIAVAMQGRSLAKTRDALAASEANNAKLIAHAKLPMDADAKVDVDEQCIGWLYGTSFVKARARVCGK